MEVQRVLALAAPLLAFLLPGCTTSPAVVDLSADVDHDRLVVQSAPGGSDWRQVRISTHETVLKVRLNAEASRADFDAEALHANAFVDVRSSPTAIQIGDFLDLCGEPYELGIYNPVVRVIDNVTKRELLEWEMFNVDRCA